MYLLFYRQPFLNSSDVVIELAAVLSNRLLLESGTPLHIAAKERNRKAIKYLVENGAFLPDNIDDTRFNPPLHYCPGLEWAYDEMKRIQQYSSSSGEASYSSES